jgi:glucokinase
LQNILIGIDVGGTKLAYGLFDEKLNLIARRRSPSMPEASAKEMIGAMARDVDALLEDGGCARSALKGIGAVFPSYIDKRRDVIVTTANLPNWVDIPIKEIFEQEFSTRVEIDNDANGAALAEHRAGAGRGREHMIYITVSTGIGGGIIINNRLFRGSFGMAGEFGHMFISDTYGAMCGCGNVGCAESIATGPSVEKYIAQKLKEPGVQTCLTELAQGGAVTTLHLAEGVRREDPFSLAVVEHVGEYLARMYVSLYQALNIDRVVYGGGLMKITLIMDVVWARFAQMVNYSERYPVEFIPAQLGDDTCMIGAALLVAGHRE